MFLKTMILFLLLAPNLYAQTIHVEYGFNIFSLEVSENKITYKKKSYTESVKKQKCSENLFHHFTEKIKALTKKAPQDHKDNGDFMVKYRIENKTGALLPTSAFAKKLLNLPRDFDSFRLTTELRCEKAHD